MYHTLCAAPHIHVTPTQQNATQAADPQLLRDLADLTAQRDSFQQLLQQRQDELVAAHEQASAATAQASALQQALHDAQAALHAEQGARSTLKQQLASQQHAAASEDAAAMDALRAEHAALTQQLEDSEAQVAELDDTNTRLEAQLMALQESTGGVQQELDVVKAALLAAEVRVGVGGGRGYVHVFSKSGCVHAFYCCCSQWSIKPKSITVTWSTLWSTPWSTITTQAARDAAQQEAAALRDAQAAGAAEETQQLYAEIQTLRDQVEQYTNEVRVCT